MELRKSRKSRKSRIGTPAILQILDFLKHQLYVEVLLFMVQEVFFVESVM